jgi:hypothetical protein
MPGISKSHWAVTLLSERYIKLDNTQRKTRRWQHEIFSYQDKITLIDQPSINATPQRSIIPALPIARA